MDIPVIKSYEDQAVDTVVSILNRAKEKLGDRQTLKQLAGKRFKISEDGGHGICASVTHYFDAGVTETASRDAVSPQGKVVLSSLKCPLPVTGEELICSTIEKKWKLTDTFMYTLNYTGSSKDECSVFYYFEAIFSQPTALYPIPQATASVFFRIEDKQIEPPEVRGVPMMTFRIEGHRWDHDVRFVLLIPDWLLGVIEMKKRLFRRIEQIRLF